jgi:hypothetical protein
MHALASVAPDPWRAVHCPCRRAVLADVRGEGGEIRRHCPRCRGWWVVDVRTGRVRGEGGPPETARAVPSG